MAKSGWRQLKTDLCEIFGAAQFSTFSTVSARSRHAPLPFDGLKSEDRFPKDPAQAK
jgi:hypothetical protein